MITKESKVSFDYTLTVDGEVLDSSKDKEPLAFTMGEQHIIAGLESEMLGLKVDDEKQVEVSPEDGYILCEA